MIMSSRSRFGMLAFALFAVAAIAWLALNENTAVLDERLSVTVNNAPKSSGPRATPRVVEAPPPVAESQNAVDTVKRLGGTTLIATNGHVLTINLTGCEVRNDDLRHLTGTPELTLLNLDNTAVGDDGLKLIRDLPKLKILRLSRTKITDSGLQYLEKLPALSSLLMNDTRVTDEGMKHLVGLPSLGQIEVMGCSVTDRAQQNINEQLPGCRVKR
jgi:Leucine Rich repeat